MPLGAEHGYPMQKNVSGVKTPLSHVRFVILGVYRLLHAAVQTDPWFTLAPSTQVGPAPCHMPVGAEQGGSQLKVGGVKLPAVHVRFVTLGV
jgi:hypothetical protein